MELSEDKLLRAFYKTISRYPGCAEWSDTDKLTLCGRIIERLSDMVDDAETGTGQPLRITRESEQIPEELWRHKRELERERRAVQPINGAPKPAPAAPRLILSPDDPEFHKAEQMLAEERGQRPPAAVAVSRVAEPTGAGLKPVQYWTYEALSQALHEKFPEKVSFTPNGRDYPITAVRNVQVKIGTDQVRLEYAHESMGQDSIEPAGSFEMGRVSIGLIASKSFSLYTRQIDVDGAMQDLYDQLCGLYQDRSNLASEVALSPSPMESIINGTLSLEKNPMQTSIRERMEPGWGKIDTSAVALDKIFHDNRQAGNRGA